MKKKSKGGKRAGAGRPKMADRMETVSIRAKSIDVQKWGGRDNLRFRLCEFMAFFDDLRWGAFYDPKAEIIDMPKAKETGIIPPTKILITTTSEAKENPNESILKQIAAIRAEKIPKERDTLFGRKSWALEQKKRVEDLENQLK